MLAAWPSDCRCRVCSLRKAAIRGLSFGLPLVCPKCGEEILLFDDGTGPSAERLGLPLVASMPWRREVAQARSLSWASLPEEVRKDAAKIAFVAERAAPAPTS